MATELLAAFPNDVHVHAAEANWGSLFSVFSTTDGIAAGGMRVADEVQSVLTLHPHLKSLSFVALSLGGLYSRFAVKLLHQRGVLERVSPVNFITLASPHLGVAGRLNSFYEVK